MTERWDQEEDYYDSLDWGGSTVMMPGLRRYLVEGEVQEINFDAIMGEPRQVAPPNNMLLSMTTRVHRAFHLAVLWDSGQGGRYFGSSEQGHPPHSVRARVYEVAMVYRPVEPVTRFSWRDAGPPSYSISMHVSGLVHTVSRDAYRVHEILR